MKSTAEVLKGIADLIRKKGFDGLYDEMEEGELTYILELAAKEYDMPRCEDFPCCGHEMGCCPDYDESGQQLNMKCTCGATVPLTSRYSICEGCMERMNEEHDDDY